MSRFFILLGLFLLNSGLSLAYSSTKVDSIRMFSRAKDLRNTYPISLLKLALAKTDKEYILVEPEERINYKRLLSNEKAGIDTGVDIFWSFSSPELEEEFIPIYIPMDRGLLGWRLFLINQSNQQRFLESNLSQLIKMRLGQGFDWQDVSILKDNGFNVYESSSYRGLFEMVRKKHIDFFPRSVNEIVFELEEFGGEELAIEKKWALHYPAPLYFFINKKRSKLAESLQIGLEKAIKDGSFESLFRSTFTPILDQLSLNTRSVITLKNKNIKAIHQIDNQDYWYNPTRGY